MVIFTVTSKSALKSVIVEVCVTLISLFCSPNLLLRNPLFKKKKKKKKKKKREKKKSHLINIIRKSFNETTI
jgi:hypothetical protein